MLFFSKNKIFFIALTLLSNYSLTQCAFSRLQSVRPAISAVTGWRSLSGCSRNDSEALRKWKSRQKQLDALGNVPKKVQDAAHIISRNEWSIDPTISLLAHHQVYNLVENRKLKMKQKGLLSNKSVVFDKNIRSFLSPQIQQKIEEIVLGVDIDSKVTIKRSTPFSSALIRSLGVEIPIEASIKPDMFEDSEVYYVSFSALFEDFFLSCCLPKDKRLPVLIPKNSVWYVAAIASFLSNLGYEGELVSGMCMFFAGLMLFYDNTFQEEFNKVKRFETFAGVLLHELGHAKYDHHLILAEVIENDLISAKETFYINRYQESEADAMVIRFKNTKYIQGIVDYLVCSSQIIGRGEEKKDEAQNFVNKGEDFDVNLKLKAATVHAHPPILERIGFLKSELEFMGQQEAAKNK